MELMDGASKDGRLLHVQLTTESSVWDMRMEVQM